MNRKCTVLLLLNISASIAISYSADIEVLRNVRSTATGFVVGGNRSNRDSWPWLVALFLTQDHEFHGGGSLISNRFILTTAHCLQNKMETEPMMPNEIIVYLGAYNLSEVQNETIVKAIPEEFFIHPHWNPSDRRFDADIAVIKLTSAVSYSEKIQPVKLWREDVRPKGQKDVGVIVGWGATENTRGGHSDVIRDVKLEVKSLFSCYEAKAVRNIISTRGLCVGGDGAGPCFGDSGGGFFSARDSIWYLRGITSSGVLDRAMSCDVNTHAVVTNVEMFKHWIDKIVRGGIQLTCEFSRGIWFYYRCDSRNLKILNDNTRAVRVIGKHDVGFSNFNVRMIRIYNQNTKYLPNELQFIFFTLVAYEVENSKVEKIQRRNFEDLSTLDWLRITNNPLKEIPADTFTDLINLKVLILSRNQIESIDCDTFMHNTRLQTLELSYNKLKVLDGSIFKNNLKLGVLNVSNNLLAVIGPEILRPLQSLTRVNFLSNTCIDANYQVGKLSSVENLTSIISSDC